MNAAHWHLVLNHIPVLGTLFGLLILGYGAWVKNEEVLRVALGLLLVSGLAVLPVYETGHAAESYVEGMSGVTEGAIEHHAEAAGLTYYLLLALAVASFAGLVQSYRTGAVPAWLLVVVGLIGLVAGVSVIRTADAGGRIHHPEIEMTEPAASGGTESSNHDHDHEH